MGINIIKDLLIDELEEIYQATNRPKNTIHRGLLLYIYWENKYDLSYWGQPSYYSTITIDVEASNSIGIIIGACSLVLMKDALD